MVNKARFKDTGKETALDKNRRVSLGTAIAAPPAGTKYKVLTNDLGQILLDPVKCISAYEAWIYENPKRIASIRRGITQAESDWDMFFASLNMFTDNFLLERNQPTKQQKRDKLFE